MVAPRRPGRLLAALLCAVPLVAHAQAADPVARHRAEYGRLQGARARMDSLALPEDGRWAAGTAAEGVVSASVRCLDGAVRVTIATRAAEGGYAVHTTWFADGRPFFTLQEGALVGAPPRPFARWYWAFGDGALVRALGTGNRPRRVTAADVRDEAAMVHDEAVALATAAPGCRRR